MQNDKDILYFTLSNLGRIIEKHERKKVSQKWRQL